MLYPAVLRKRMAADERGLKDIVVIMPCFMGIVKEKMRKSPVKQV